MSKQRVRMSCHTICFIMLIFIGRASPQCVCTCPCPPPVCCNLCIVGCQQSPININANAAVDTDLPAVRYFNHWAGDICPSMSIAGQTVLIKPPPECRMSIDGGPLSSSYILDQLHFHWGETNNNGTEHCIDSTKYAMEAHLVYYNCFYDGVLAAIGQPDGIAIISVFLEAKPNYQNPHMDPIVNNLCRIKYPGSIIVLRKNPIKMFKDILESQDYFTYEGSLTTPPCSEDVLWLVFKDFVDIHCTQVAPFRLLSDACGCRICRNWRKTQPLNGRTVYRAKATICPCLKRAL